jgi:hypothetical protein
MEPEVSSVRVAVRIRPLSQQESAASSHVCIRTTPGEPQVRVEMRGGGCLVHVLLCSREIGEVLDEKWARIDEEISVCICRVCCVIALLSSFGCGCD